MSVKADLVRSVDIDAAPSVVWELLTDPGQMARWMGRKVEADPTPGGAYRININDWATAAGEYVEVVPRERLVMSFGWEGGDPAPGGSTVTITLEPVGAGTRVTLAHDGLSDALRDQHEHGWEHYLARLVAVGNGRDPGPDPMESAVPPS